MSVKIPQRIFSITLLVGMLLGFVQPASVQANPSIAEADASGKIEGFLIGQFETQGTADFILRFTAQADLTPAYEMDWEERGWFVYNTLTETADKSQAQAKGMLDAMGYKYQTFINGNELYIWDGKLDTAEALAALAEVDSIRAPRTYYIDPVTEEQVQVFWAGDLLSKGLIFSTGASTEAITDWGITDTKADQFWTQYGFQGGGILVANIDTGVQWDHPALVNQFNCPGDPGNPACWEDPSNICSGGTACDNNGHGTHTMGTMVALDDPSLTYIAGMAPEAKWIACKGCETSSCSEFALNTCADWIVAPNGNPNNRPHIVNNSWGGGGGDNWYLAKVNAWRAAGTFPAFSAGNNYSCSSLGSPGDYQESFASASHMSNRTISDFSSKGPSTFGHDPYTKPNISAPGSSICSTVPTNSWSCSYSGTSMASPHSAGAVALLWSCNASLIGQIDQTFEILQDTANTPPTGSCGAPPDGEGNYTYGYGYLDVLAAGLLNCGDVGYIDGTVTESGTGTPIAGVTVTAQGLLEAGTNAVTDPNGYYQMTVLVGTYSVMATHPEYTTVVIPGVVVTTGMTTTVDMAMDPKGRLFGYVTDFDNSFPLSGATVTADDGTSAMTDVSGFYEMLLDAGTYVVTATLEDYAPESAIVSIVSGLDTQQDFSLLAAISVIPDPIHMTITIGSTGNMPATIYNNLPEPYSFEFVEVDMGPNSILSSGGPDPYGYTFVDSNEPGGPDFNWIDATDGTPLNPADDGEVNVTLPFSFNFYGTVSTAIRVGNNGGIIFNATTGDLFAGNADLSGSTTNNILVPFWDDIDSDTGNVYYKVIGSAPARIAVIEWFDRPHYSNVGDATFELLLYEGTNNIKFQYQDVVFGNVSYDYGASATVGIKKDTTAYLQYSYNQAVITDGLAICFQFPGAPPCDGGDIPWFGTSIVSGTVPADGGSLSWANYFSATQDAGIEQPGTYQGNLSIYPTSVGMPSKVVPVIMTVEPTALWGLLQGVVSSDRPGGPLEALVNITDGGAFSVTVPTDPETGYYEKWLVVDDYQVTASAVDYISQTVSVSIPPQGVFVQDFVLVLNAPGIVVDPTAFEVSLLMGDQLTETLTVGNIGQQTLDFAIYEQPGGFDPGMDSAGGPDPFGYIFKDTSEPDGPIYLWIDATDGTPLDLTDDGEANVTLPFLFNFYGISSDLIRIANNGGFIFNATSGDLSTVNQDLSTGTMNNIVVPFWDDIDADTGNVYYKTVGEPPNRIFVIEWYNRPHFNNIGNATFELLLFEGSNNIKFQYQDVVFGNVSYDFGASATVGIKQDLTYFLQYSYNQAVLQDETAICFQFPGSPPCDSRDVEWVSENPVEASVPIGEQLPIDVIFDAAAVAEPGTYTANLYLVNNDPIVGAVQVPLTMHVQPTADMGLLEGVITSSGYCGEANDPLSAEVFIEDSGGNNWTVISDPDSGEYLRWLVSGSYTVTVSAVEHVTATEVVQVTAQQTTTLDVALRWIESCMDVTPTSFSVSIPVDTVFTETLSLINNGAGELLWELHETTATLPLSIPAFQGTIPPDTAPVSFGRAPDTSGGEPSPDNWFINGMPAYAVDLFDNNLYYWADIDNPGAGGPVGLIGSGDYYAGDFMDNDFSILYVINNAAQQLVAVDVATGVGTPIGPCIPGAGQTWTGMSWDDTTNTMYATATDGLLATLFTVNLDTGAATEVVDISNAPYVIDIAVNQDGIMYGHEIALDSIITIDKVTGATTVIGPTGFNANYAQGMDFDAESGILYLLSYNGTTSTGELRIADINTGATTLIGTLPGSDEMDALGIQAAGAGIWYDVPWVSEVPTTGVTIPDSTYFVDVVFDSTGLTQGECYTASLGIVHDDPGWETPYMIPLELCVEYVYDVKLSDDMQASGEPGDTITYTLAITNLGSTTDTFDLALGSFVFPTSLESNVVGPLGAGESTTVDVFVEIPGDAQDGEFDEVTVTASSQTNPEAMDSATLTTTCVIIPVYGVDVSGDMEANGLPGDTITYTLTITNIGNKLDTFDLALSSFVFPTSLETSLVGPLVPGETAVVEIYVEIPAEALPGEYDEVTVTATSQTDPSATDGSVLTTTVIGTLSFDLEPEASTLTGAPAQTLTYTLQLTNTGDIADTYVLTVSGVDTDWVVVLPVNTFDLAGQESVEVLVVVTIPADADDGDFDTITVTATSENDGAWDEIEITTTVEVSEPPLFLTFLPVSYK